VLKKRRVPNDLRGSCEANKRLDADRDADRNIVNECVLVWTCDVRGELLYKGKDNDGRSRRFGSYG
jgi:hypothetical protein